MFVCVCCMDDFFFMTKDSYDEQKSMSFLADVNSNLWHFFFLQNILRLESMKCLCLYLDGEEFVPWFFVVVVYHHRL